MNNNIIVNKNLIIAIGVVVILIIGGFIAYKIITTPQNDEPPVVNGPAETEVSLGGIDVGLTVDKLKEKLGEPNSAPRNMGDYEIYSYNNLEIDVRNNKVHSLMTDSPGVTTFDGVQVSSNFDDMIARYGSDYEKRVDKMRIYEYSRPALNNQNGAVIFSVDSQDKVVSIVVCLKAETKSESSPEAEQAKLALHKFINTIARNESEIRRAYRDMLTNHYKATVPEEVFVKMCSGFTALNYTKDFEIVHSESNSNSVVLAFEAESRTPVTEGILYQHWIGTIKMAKEADAWKINDVNSKCDFSMLEAPKE